MTIVFSVFALLISAAALFLSWRADQRQKKAQEREDKSASMQIKPLVQAKPVVFIIERGFGQTTLEVTNPSGYEAYGLSLDIKYEDIDWIVEWLRANRQPPEEVLRLGPAAGFVSIFNGALPYTEEEICTQRKTFSVFVRVKWANEKGRKFETTARYQLVCTTVGDNRSFTFLLQDQTSYE
jgi:hypothetical protein